MIVYNVGDKVRVKESSNVIGVRLEKNTEGIVVAVHEGRVEAAFEGLGTVSVLHDLIKKKVHKIERLVKAKNLKLSDEIHIPGSGEYVKLGNISRDDYSAIDTTISVETIQYNYHEYGVNELVEVRR